MPKPRPVEPKTESNLMGVGEYAKHRGVSIRNVSRAIKDGRISKTPEGKIDAEQADLDWSIATIQVEKDVPKFAVSRAAREFYQARLKKLEWREKRGNLLDVREVRSAVSAMISQAKSKLTIIGEELGDKLATTADPVKCREMVDERIRQALAELAEYPTAA